MKKLILALLTLLPFSSFSQATKEKSPGKIAVGIVFSPDYCYRTVNRDYSVGHSVPKFGFTTGASILYKINKDFVFESGLLFSDKGEKLKDITIRGFDETYSVSHIYDYYYLDIPAKVNYYVTSGKAKLFVSLGASANIFLYGKITSEYYDKTNRFTYTGDFDLSVVNLAGLAGIGLDYDATDKLKIRVEPIFRHSIIPISDSYYYKTYLYSAGVNFGMYFRM